MKKRLTEAQAGVPVKELCRKHGLSGGCAQGGDDFAERRGHVMKKLGRSRSHRPPFCARWR